MKIVLTKRNPFSTPDGISHFLFSLANELITRGHEVVGVTTNDLALDLIAERFAYPHLPPIISLNGVKGHNHLFAFTAWLRSGSEVIAAQKPDLILVNGAVPCHYTAPSVTIAHDVDRRYFPGIPWPRRLYKSVTYRRTDRLVTTCSELAEPVARDAFFPIDKIDVIPTCITPELYHPRPLQERTPAILHIGMQNYKNPLATIRAFLPLANLATLSIVGKINPEVRHFVDSLPQHQRTKIELPGIVSGDELKRLLETARVVSVPSKYNFPVASPTVLEAFACHTPVVVSSYISQDIFEPKTNGLLADQESERMRAFEILLTDDTQWKSLSQGAANTVNRFSAASVADRYLALFSTANSVASKAV